MLRMVWSQLRRRGGRTIALLLAILVAAGGFTVLTASSAANRLQAVGTVKAHARTVYDVLVRPKGARSDVEQAQNLVQPGFLSGIYGGITLAQWEQIKALPGIDVAAPVAMVGYVVPRLLLPVNMRAALPTTADGVARLDVAWSFDNGLSHEKQAPDFAYLTTHPLPLNAGFGRGMGFYLQPGLGAAAPAACPKIAGPSTATVSSRPSTINCFSLTEGGSAMFLTWPAGLVGQQLAYSLPIVAAPVGPVVEDTLE